MAHCSWVAGAYCMHLACGQLWVALGVSRASFLKMLLSWGVDLLALVCGFSG